MVLLIYCYLMIYNSALVIFDHTRFLDWLNPPRPTAVMNQSLSVAVGLVSALVIAELATTKPGEEPTLRVAAKLEGRISKNLMMWTSRLYILAWLLFGGIAFLVSLHYPNASPTLSSIGQSWFGLAVVSGYAYFGLNS